MDSHGKDELKGPVLHIVVVGFHHKKGCQVWVNVKLLRHVIVSLACLGW